MRISLWTLEKQGQPYQGRGGMLPMCFAPFLSPSYRLNRKWGRSKGKGPPKSRLDYFMLVVGPHPVTDPAHLVLPRHLLGAILSG